MYVGRSMATLMSGGRALEPLKLVKPGDEVVIDNSESRRAVLPPVSSAHTGPVCVGPVPRSGRQAGLPAASEADWPRIRGIRRRNDSERALRGQDDRSSPCGIRMHFPGRRTGTPQK